MRERKELRMTCKLWPKPLERWSCPLIYRETEGCRWMVICFSAATLGCMDIGAEMAESELFHQSSSRRHEIHKGMGECDHNSWPQMVTWVE